MIINGKGEYPKEILIPGDKSISHRSIIFASISKGKTIIENILLSEDIIMTINCFKDMGVEIYIDRINNKVIVNGVGLNGLKEPKGELYCGNSGTTMRLLAGLLVGQKFETTLVGDKSLNTRPMNRIIEPLSKMGANITSTKEGTAPIKIKRSKKLQPINYTMPVESAQVKSAILLASLYTKGTSRIIEKNPSRDHTERMLEYFKENNWSVDKLIIPGDISSASFFIVASVISENSPIKIRNVGINKTRLGLIKNIMKMGGNIKVTNERILNSEPIGDLIVKPSRLKSIKVDKSDIVSMVDEIPILAVAGVFAEGGIEIRGAEELRYKESDRITAIVREFKKFSIDIKEFPDGFMIGNIKKLKPAQVESYGDHRIAMSLSILANNIEGTSEILSSECVNVSFPNFYDILIAG